MSDIKSMSFSDKDLGGSRPTSEKVSEVGVVEGLSQPKHSILERCLSYARLDSGDDMSVAGRWSNAVVTYWLCDAVAPGNLRLGSSLVTLGFSWKVTIGIIALGHFLISLAITANSVIGARYHIPYTIQSRASFGFFFSFVVVFIRMLVGFFWYGLNTYTRRMCQCGWACHVSGGGLHTTLMKQDTTLHGSAYTWAFLSGLNSMLGNYGTMAVNINDFARYARSSRMIVVQIIIIPLSFMLMSFIGIIIAGAASDLYGKEIWDPLTIMSHWTGSHQSRAGAVFVGLSFVLAQLGSNISANCISAANDLNAMFPRYINLRRGSYLIAFIGAWALTPWNILSSAAALLDFMDGYVIWLAPITGVLLADYYIVHRRTYDIEEMYLPNGIYRYNKFGTNWRAVAAWLVGCVPLIPGFASSLAVDFSGGGELI
ncbi:putative permease [Lachnellula subtilissima]|uniref:Putative permease n=1 Tax=Lachnellula subtilissima TaxID=602034 RepID=A0A8H8UGG8_9HELO|nr:putative permease [Lachnellula subtilissima]